MNPRTMLIIQVILEAALPLYGFFFWGWSLYFVLLYYLLELIADQVFVHFKSAAIRKDQNLPGISTGSEILGVVLLVFTLISSHFVVLVLHPESNLSSEFLAFLRYEEMGIQQGFLILPLVFFAGWQQYKLQFLRIGAAKMVQLNRLLKSQQVKYYLLLLLSLLCMLLAYSLVKQEIFYIFTLIGSTSVYKLLSRHSFRSAQPGR